LNQVYGRYGHHVLFNLLTIENCNFSIDTYMERNEKGFFAGSRRAANFYG